MKIIFLDVDGVLNDAHTPDRAPGGYIGINSGMVAQLKRIIDCTDAKVVLVSTWKSEWDKNPENIKSADGKYLAECMRNAGIEIMDKTEDHISNRGEGIAKYLSTKTNVESWIVLDDDMFADYQKYGITPHLVRTSFGYGGLTQKHADQAIDKLNQ